MGEPLRRRLRRFSIIRTIADIVYRFPPFAPKPILEASTWGDEFPSERFLVIRRGEYGVGLFSLFITTLSWIRYADEHGMIPVVDMQTEKNLYQKRSFFRRENAWEHFFEQPAGYGLERIRRAKNIVIARAFSEQNLPSQWMDCDPDRNPEIETWRAIVERHINIRYELLSPWRNAHLESAFAAGNGVLGVLARGTDYTTVKPIGHPIQPSCQQLFDRIDSLAKEGLSFSSIYLVTEDTSIAAQFAKRYQERLILSRQDTLAYSGGYLRSNKHVAHNVDRGHAYLKAIYDLARCDYLVSGRTSGMVGAVLLSKGFKRTELFDLGSY